MHTEILKAPANNPSPHVPELFAEMARLLDRAMRNHGLGSAESANDNRLELAFGHCRISIIYDPGSCAGYPHLATVTEGHGLLLPKRVAHLKQEIGLEELKRVFGT